jgi:hypothetical protein
MGPRFGLKLEDTARAQLHRHTHVTSPSEPNHARDARGSPHSAAIRRGAAHQRPETDETAAITSTIREAQSDPTSMFDMSTP